MQLIPICRGGMDHLLSESQSRASLLGANPSDNLEFRRSSGGRAAQVSGSTLAYPQPLGFSSSQRSRSCRRSEATVAKHP